MKKILVIILLLFPQLLWGAALISDQTPVSDAVTNFKLFFDGGVAIDSVPVNRAISYNLSGLANGNHTVVAQACNIVGCSVNSAPFAFVLPVPLVPVGPAGLKVIP